MTKVTDVFERFLSKITNYSFLTISKEELEATLMDYLRSAIANFHKCKKSLNIVDDENGEKVFEEELTPYEQEILAMYMIIEYLRPRIVTDEIIEQSLSDKDFKIYSQANQLRELNLLYRMLRREVDKKVTEYTYFDIEDDFND